MNSLVVFEVSARLLSVTLAAEELTITREAVSRHIRRLESHLGVKLFLRLHRALELTDPGQRFLAAVQEALAGIRQSAQDLQDRSLPATVTVVATHAIASFWLTPRLPRFREREPNLRIRMRTSDYVPDLQREGIDVGLFYGEGRWPGLAARKLFAIESFPVCAPGYLSPKAPIHSPADLPAHSLLNLEGGRHSSEDWHWWLGSFMPEVPRPLQIVSFDNYANVIQAAAEGQGIALGYGQLVEGLLARGTLVRVLDASLDAGKAAYLVTPQRAKLQPAAAGFVAWVEAEARGESPGN